MIWLYFIPQLSGSGLPPIDTQEAVMADIQRDPFNFAPPGGESLRDVEHRVTCYLRREVLPRVRGAHHVWRGMNRCIGL